MISNSDQQGQQRRVVFQPRISLSRARALSLSLALILLYRSLCLSCHRRAVFMNAVLLFFARKYQGKWKGKKTASKLRVSAHFTFPPQEREEKGLTETHTHTRTHFLATHSASNCVALHYFSMKCYCLRKKVSVVIDVMSRCFCVHRENA